MNENGLPGWTDQARRVLDESAQSLDAATLSRLNRARQAALEQRRPTLRPWFVPAGLASACAVLLALAVVWRAPVPMPANPGAPAPIATAMQSNGVAAGDLDIVSGDEGLEFYQDLEFYAWLDAQNQDGDG